MKIGIFCIGDELLKGSTINTNLSFLGQTLLENGIVPEFSLEIPDAKKSILESLERFLPQVDVLLTSGGLGPTADDITKEIIAGRLHRTLEENGEVAASILRYWKTVHHEEMPPRIMNQSLVPRGANVLLNRCGTAPGLILETAADPEFPGKTVILLPGPPSELQPMFRTDVLPYLLEKRDRCLYSKLFLLAGIGESVVEDRMLPVIQTCHPLSVAYCASAQYVKLFLTSPDSEVLTHAIRNVRGLFEEELLADSSASLPEDVLTLLRKNNATLATAESCTGGLIAKQLTDIPGSSDVFLGSIVSYANQVKQKMLGVSAETLEHFGAVSRECAEEMLDGLTCRFETDAAISVTGIAGPDGGSPEKPVGLVYVGVRYRDQKIIRELHLRRTREQIRERTAAKALNLLRRMILGLDPDR